MPKTKKVESKVRRATHATHATQAQIKSQTSAGQSYEGTLVRRYTTKDGIKLELKGVPRLIVQDIPGLIEKEWRDKGKTLPKKPTYQIEVAGGELETYEHDETTLETDEEKRAWGLYLERDEEMGNEIASRFLKAALAMGIVSITAGKDKLAEWDEALKAMGYKLNANSSELKMMHVRMGVHDEEDIQNILENIMAMSGIDTEVLARSRKGFRRDVEGEDKSL
jgi:hypothetical protein